MLQNRSSLDSYVSYSVENSQFKVRLRNRRTNQQGVEGAQIDTITSNGRLFFGIFAALAEFEWELIAERTHAGLAAARARGRKGGRPRKMDRPALKMAMTAMADRKSNASDVAKRLGITTTTLYAYVNGDGSVKASGLAHWERSCSQTTYMQKRL